MMRRMLTDEVFGLPVGPGGARCFAGGVLWNMPDGENGGWFPLYPMYAAPGKTIMFPTQNVTGQLYVKWHVQTIPMMQ